MTYHRPDTDDATGRDRFEHDDGTPDHAAIARARRFGLPWWGGVSEPGDVDPWGET